MSTLDWGSVPAWVSSILTSGSLLLGFYILLRDRRTAEESDARKLVVVATTEPDRVKVTVHNHADRPFYALMLMTSNDTGIMARRTVPVLTQFPQRVLLPNEHMTATVSFPRHFAKDWIITSACVVYVDADGRPWARLPITNDLIRMPHHRMRRLGRYWLGKHQRRSAKLLAQPRPPDLTWGGPTDNYRWNRGRSRR